MCAAWQWTQAVAVSLEYLPEPLSTHTLKRLILIPYSAAPH